MPGRRREEAVSHSRGRVKEASPAGAGSRQTTATAEPSLVAHQTGRGRNLAGIAPTKRAATTTSARKEDAPGSSSGRLASDKWSGGGGDERWGGEREAGRPEAPCLPPNGEWARAREASHSERPRCRPRVSLSICPSVYPSLYLARALIALGLEGREGVVTLRTANLLPEHLVTNSG